MAPFDSSAMKVWKPPSFCRTERSYAVSSSVTATQAVVPNLQQSPREVYMLILSVLMQTSQLDPGCWH